MLQRVACLFIFRFNVQLRYLLGLRHVSIYVGIYIERERDDDRVSPCVRLREINNPPTTTTNQITKNNEKNESDESQPLQGASNTTHTHTKFENINKRFF